MRQTHRKYLGYTSYKALIIILTAIEEKTMIHIFIKYNFIHRRITQATSMLHRYMTTNIVGKKPMIKILIKCHYIHGRTVAWLHRHTPQAKMRETHHQNSTYVHINRLCIKTNMYRTFNGDGECLLLQIGSKLIDPPEATRLSSPLQEAFGSNGAPVSGAILLHMV
jgi:hypothetical protein